MESNQMTCRRCKHTVWRHLTTTAVLIDGKKRTQEPSDYLKKEFRCANCNTKATMEQVTQLESLLQSTDVSSEDPAA